MVLTPFGNAGMSQQRRDKAEQLLARLRDLALFPKSFRHGGRFPDPCTSIRAEAIRPQPFLLGVGPTLCVCIKLWGLLMLDFENSWPGNVFLSAVEMFKLRPSKRVKCNGSFVGPGPI